MADIKTVQLLVNSERAQKRPYQKVPISYIYINAKRDKLPAKERLSRFWSERGDSNARPLRPERSALPTALLSDILSRER